MVSARVWRKSFLPYYLNFFTTPGRHFCSTGPPWRVLFYGTDDFALTSLKQLHQSADVKNVPTKLVETIEVVCTANPLPIRKYAHVHSLPIYTWPHEAQVGKHDIGVVVSFGHMIPEASILAMRHGMINVHASLLPRWRGAAPIPHTILNGDRETGVTIMEVTPNKFDVGQIVKQRSCSVPEGATTVLLRSLLANLGAELLLECLSDLEGNLLMAQPQPEQSVTIARKPHVRMATVDWSRHDSDHVDRMYRALDYIFNLRTTWHGTGIKLLNMVEQKETTSARMDILIQFPVPAGWCFFHKKRKILFVRCLSGWVAFRHVQVTGKRTMTAQEFYSGYLAQVPNTETVFGT